MPRSGRRVHEAPRDSRPLQPVEHPSGLLPALQEEQRRAGCVAAAAVPALAERFNLSQAEVHGVVHFYHDFSQQPKGKHVLRVCRAEACQAMQAEQLIVHLQQRLGIGLGQTTPDGACTLEAVYCLGNCALSPAVMLDERLHGRVSPARADQLLAGIAGT